MWSQALIFVVLALAVVLAHGRSRWTVRTRSLRAALSNARVPIEPAPWTAPPEPARRYLRAVLPDGLPRILSARITHSGTFRLGGRWLPFTSDQLTVTRRPGFDWDARIFRAIFVHDAYIAGAGLLHASLLGLVKLTELKDTPEIADAELQRFLAEAVWYPTVLAPGGDVRWDELDANTAIATLRDGRTSVTLSFHFNEAGHVARVASRSRCRIVDGVPVPTPWECRVWNYQRHSGILIPTEGEVSWDSLPYWRGRITSVYFEFERTPS